MDLQEIGTTVDKEEDTILVQQEAEVEEVTTLSQWQAHVEAIKGPVAKGEPWLLVATHPKDVVLVMHQVELGRVVANLWEMTKTHQDLLSTSEWDMKDTFLYN